MKALYCCHRCGLVKAVEVEPGTVICTPRTDIPCDPCNRSSFYPMADFLRYENVASAVPGHDETTDEIREMSITSAELEPSMFIEDMTGEIIRSVGEIYGAHTIEAHRESLERRKQTGVKFAKLAPVEEPAVDTTNRKIRRRRK